MKRIIIASLVAITTMLVSPTAAFAHHTTITCSDQETSTWSIVNSENRSMTFTTDQGHDGAIGPLGTAEVTYVGSSLTVYGVWSNGVERTNTGEGNCIPVPTTTTTTSTTTTTTEVPPSTTTSTSTPPSSTTSTSSSTPSTTTATTTTSSAPTTSTVAPTTTVIGSTSTSSLPTTVATTAPPTPTTDPSTVELPETGASTTVMTLWALAILLLGSSATWITRRPTS